MAWTWQLWLSPRPQRSVTASDPQILSAYDSSLFEFLREDDGRWVVRETHDIENPWVRNGLSGPALHIHWKQHEYFQVEQGVVGIHNNGQDVRLTKDDGVLHVPPGTRHKFWSHSSNEENLVLRVWADPQDIDHIFDERFLRNLISYQRDCQKANMAPSPFQLLLTSYDCGTLASPPFWVPLWLLHLVHFVLAYWVGAFLLGYKSSYPEYYNEPAKMKKKA